MTDLKKCDLAWCTALISALSLEDMSTVAYDVAESWGADEVLSRNDHWHLEIAGTLSIPDANDVFAAFKSAAEKQGISPDLTTGPIPILTKESIK